MAGSKNPERPKVGKAAALAMAWRRRGFESESTAAVDTRESGSALSRVPLGLFKGCYNVIRLQKLNSRVPCVIRFVQQMVYYSN